MNAGRFWTFFYNSTGEFANVTVDAVSIIGANVAVSLLSRAFAVYFGSHRIPVDLSTVAVRRQPKG